MTNDIGVQPETVWHFYISVIKHFLTNDCSNTAASLEQHFKQCAVDTQFW